MGKLSEAQKDALEWLYEVGNCTEGKFFSCGMPRHTTLYALVRKGFVTLIRHGSFEINKFGINVVRMMRGEMKRR